MATTTIATTTKMLNKTNIKSLENNIWTELIFWEEGTLVATTGDKQR